MTAGMTFVMLVVAGAALVVQNLLMAKITGAASSVLVALLLNSAVGFVLLSVVLLGKFGVAVVGEIAGAFRLWFLIPGVLGTFFVFASITGYRTVGAAPTIAVLVASQLVIGLVWDITRSEDITLQGILTALLGASLLVGGMFIIASRNT